MAWDFPASPTTNQVFTPVAGTSYIWNGQAWVQTTAGGLPVNYTKITVGPTAPVGPVTNELWVDTT